MTTECRMSKNIHRFESCIIDAS